MVLAVTGAPGTARWVGSVWSLAVAVRPSLRMVRDVRAGQWRVDVLAVTATALVGEYVAALVVVLMLTGGQALEDYDLVTTLNALRALRPGRARAD